MNDNCCNNRGFTLLEVMIALAIVAIALVTLLGLSNRSIHVQERIHKLTRATLLAQQLMSEEEAAPRSGQADWSPKSETFTEPFADYRYEVSYQDTFLERVKQVTVVVLWGEPQKNEQVQLDSFVTF